MAFLEQLNAGLQCGAMTLPECERRRHASFLRSHQQPDGGFPGRRGGSDLYYTSFALRGLTMLGELAEETARRSAAYLAATTADVGDLVALHSFASCAALIQSAVPNLGFAEGGRDWLDKRTDEVLGPLRRDDGGWARSPRSGPSSVYHTFLAATLLDRLGRLPAPARREKLVQMIVSRRRNDGGFAELPPMTAGGTNPTAAAVNVLGIFNALDCIDTHSVAKFFTRMQTAEGGIRAHARIDVADLLSTFTALVTLKQLQAYRQLDLAAVERFATALASPGGGFAAARFDPSRDCEYTFYGLACKIMSSDADQ